MAYQDAQSGDCECTQDCVARGTTMCLLMHAQIGLYELRDWISGRYGLHFEYRQGLALDANALDLNLGLAESLLAQNKSADAAAVLRRVEAAVSMDPKTANRLEALTRAIAGMR